MSYLRHISFALAVAFASLVCTECRQLSAQPASKSSDSPQPFRWLLNNKDLAGWHGDNPHQTVKAARDKRKEAIESQQQDFKKHWTNQYGDLVNDGEGPYATSDESYGDIELLIDYKTVAHADSGIYLRGNPQVQIWDINQPFKPENPNRNPGLGSGGLFNNTPKTPGRDPLTQADEPFGEWNKFRILQIGSRTTVFLNNRLVVDNAIMEHYTDRKSPLPAKGPIHLQTHGGEIRWRNIRVREIGADEAIGLLRGNDAGQGFTALFNGKDLTGWSGASDNYEVVEGAIACKQGKGGVLFTADQYEDFVARVEFKVPAGGNNGLAIRYPGKGQASYDAMCELQILDESHPRYAKLDPRQYHGAVYGMVPAHPGYLRPAGQWNFQEVTVKGSTIRVELNGSVIVDADVSKVTEFKDGRPHPGKDLKRGHFGFAGHNDAVMFRNVAIKRLN